MKYLTVLRHAKSSWKETDRADIDRPLNKRGKHDAPLMGRIIARRVEHPERILCSPAKRARKTAEFVADAISYPHEQIDIIEEIYDADVDTLLTVLYGLKDEFRRIMLIGHNPSITGLLNYLTPSGIDNVRTCGTACIELPVESWKDITRGIGSTIFYDIPKNHY